MKNSNIVVIPTNNIQIFGKTTLEPWGKNIVNVPVNVAIQAKKTPAKEIIVLTAAKENFIWRLTMHRNKKKC